MTAIAIWCNHEVRENPGLWIAADSRVTSGDSVLINDAAKLFGLSVVCRSPGKNGFFSEIYYTHTYGYCFAGSTLMAQNTYLALVPLLSDLVSATSYIPSLADVAKHMLSYLRLTFEDYKQGGRVQPFEIGLFGYCSKTSKLSMFHYTLKREDGVNLTVSCEPHENMQDKKFIYLGSQRDHMISKIETAFAGKSIPGRPLSRIPRYVIQDHIDDREFLCIGGDLQLGIADRFGFRPFMLCKPRVAEQPAALISYLGRELTPDIANVGEATVGGPAIA